MLDALDLMDIHYGMSVKVKYEGEIFFGQSFICDKKTLVQCLKLRFGILEPQEFEQGEDTVFYEMVYATGVNPVMVKNGRKWMWRY